MTGPRAGRLTAAALVASVLISVVTGCGGRSAAAVSTQASAALSQQVALVRAAAASGDLATARADLDQLRSLVARLQAQGQISADRAAQILAAATDVATQLALSTPTTAAAPTTTSVSPAHADHSSGDKGGDKKK